MSDWQMAYVYILECSDGSYWVGSTRNLEARLWQHNQGLGGEYTSKRLPVRLVYAYEFERVVDAWGVERRILSTSSRTGWVASGGGVAFRGALLGLGGLDLAVLGWRGGDEVLE